MSNSFRVRNYCCRSYFRVVLKSKMKWKCWNRLDVKSKRTHHKHTRVATRGVLVTVQRTNNSIKMFYPDSNMHIFQFLVFASLRQGWITYYACPWHHLFYQDSPCSEALVRSEIYASERTIFDHLLNSYLWMPTKEEFYEYVRNATHGKKCCVIYFLGWIDFLTPWCFAARDSRAWGPQKVI